jgi:hypothetical protein
VAFLAGVALLELVLNRVVIRLIHLDFLQPRSTLTRVLDDTGLFAFELVSVLATLLLLAALVRVALGTEPFRPGARASIPLIGTVFVVLSMLGVLVKLPPNLQFHMHLSFVFMSLLLALSVVASPASGATKLGTLLLLLTLELRIVPNLLVMVGRLPRETFWRGETMGLITLGCATVGLVLLIPRGSGRRLLSSVLTWIVVCAAAFLIRKDWETAARIAAYGFGVDLPVTPWGQLICLAALAAGLYATLRCLTVPGTTRLRGWGLLLVGLGGLQLELPGQLALVGLGLFCLAISAVRVDGAPLSREAFDTVLRHAAGLLGATSVTVTGDPGEETARVHSPAGQPPVAVAVTRRVGTVIDVDIAVGEPPPRDPPFTLTRRGSGRLGPQPDGARVLTEDPAFDRAFEVRDKRGDGAPLLDEETRKRLASQVRGWLGVWPQRGVRYHARELPPGDETLAQLIVLLRELAARTA